MIKEIRIRAFRATDDLETCETFVREHKKILEDHGITQVTSSNHEWVEHPSSFVIVVETLDGKTMLGGVRIQIADGIKPLPIEMATGGMDFRIFNIIREKAVNGIGEICGLWNSKEATGLGLGIYFATQSAMAISHQIGLSSLFVLCAPYTVDTIRQFGGSEFTAIGNKGTFYYPKLDLVATAMYIEDLSQFKYANTDKRERLIALIQNPKQLRVEKVPKNDTIVNIHYNLTINNIVIEEFKKPYTTDFSTIIKPSKIMIYFPN